MTIFENITDFNDPSAYTSADLMDALITWHIDAYHITTMAEDLPDGALLDMCKRLFGPDGEEMKYLITQAATVTVVDEKALDRSAPIFFGTERF